MSVTIYTLGDSETVRVALQAVSMLFDPGNTDMWVSNTAMGMGTVAQVGLMVAFGSIAAGMIMKQKIEVHHLLLAILAYVVMFVPKIDVEIQDLHTGRVALVDNVPAGLALPGAIIGALTYSATEKIETVMSSATSEYSTLSGQGYVQPLRLLMSLRGGIFRDNYPSKNLNYLIGTCITYSGAHTKAYWSKASPNSRMAYIENNVPASRMTLWFSDAFPNGELLNCPEAATRFRGDLEALINAPASIEGNSDGLSMIEIQANAGTMMQKPGLVMGTAKWRVSDIASAAENVVSGGIRAQDLMESLITFNLENNTFHCGRQDDPNYALCSAGLTEAMENWKFDAAAAASMFQKTMIPSMNILMFMFYAFAPIMAFVIIMSGYKGAVQVLPKYMLFGVWTQTWMPTMAIINYFIQLQTQEAFRGFSTGSGVPLANMGYLYDALSTKVAVASDLMAAVPILTLSLLSGSIFALAQFATKSQGRDSFDETRASGHGVMPSQKAKYEQMIGDAPLLKISGANPETGLDGLSVSTSLTNSLAYTRKQAISKANAALASAVVASAQDDAETRNWGREGSFGATLKAAGNHGHERGTQETQQLAHKLGAELRELSSKDVGLDVANALNAGMMGLLGGLGKGLKGAALKDYIKNGLIKSLGIKAGMAESIAMATKNSYDQAATKAASEIEKFSAGLEDAHAAGDTEKWGIATSSKDSRKLTRQLSDAIERRKTLEESVNEDSKTALAAQAHGDVSAQDGMRMLMREPGWLRQAKSFLTNKYGETGAQRLIEQQGERVERAHGTKLESGWKEAGGVFQAMLGSGHEGKAELAKMFFGRNKSDYLAPTGLKSKSQEVLEEVGDPATGVPGLELEPGTAARETAGVTAAGKRAATVAAEMNPEDLGELKRIQRNNQEIVGSTHEDHKRKAEEKGKEAGTNFMKKGPTAHPSPAFEQGRHELEGLYDEKGLATLMKELGGGVISDVTAAAAVAAMGVGAFIGRDTTPTGGPGTKGGGGYPKAKVPPMKSQERSALKRIAAWASHSFGSGGKIARAVGSRVVKGLMARGVAAGAAAAIPGAAPIVGLVMAGMTVADVYAAVSDAIQSSDASQEEKDAALAAIGPEPGSETGIGPASPPSGMPAGSQPTSTQTRKQAFVDQYQAAAQLAANRLNALASDGQGNVQPEWVLGQWAQETGWGQSAVGQNNLGNIKAGRGWEGTSTSVDALEYDANGNPYTEQGAAFRNYSSPEAFVDDYVRIVGRTGAQNADSPEEFGEFLERGGYATDPQYSEKLARTSRSMPPDSAGKKVS